MPKRANKSTASTPAKRAKRSEKRTHMRIAPGCKITWHDAIETAMGGSVQFVGKGRAGRTKFEIYADEEGMLKGLYNDAYLAELVRQLGCTNFRRPYIWGPLVVATGTRMTEKRATAIEREVRAVWEKMIAALEEGEE